MLTKPSVGSPRHLTTNKHTENNIMEGKDSQATRFRDLLIEQFHLPTDLQVDPMQITVEELVQRAFVLADDPVMCDIEFLAICAEILE